MCSSDELACVYSALILTDDDVAVTPEKIMAILKAANVSVEPFWPALFARALGSVNIKDLINNVGSAPAAGAAAAPAAAAADNKEEEKKKEESEEEEEDDDMGFGLFD